MKSVQDAIYNWLTIKVVADARPDDHAAQETLAFFDLLLKEDHGVESLTFTKDDVMYLVTYVVHGEAKAARFPVELIDVMYEQIEREPHKYVNYSE
ncbi:hypothetical protein ACFOU2_12425 [Bacillus songklensis]|uniref:Uncharacterized protein n=1 Tax=Bacillus songklensis TaxID=1069116 RepID=A0ABV8B1U2_9BACI